MNADLMQCRPLGMVLLRGKLPRFFGHCIVGGKTGLTITSPVQGIWQIGGEIAEQLASESDPAVAELQRQPKSVAGCQASISRAARSPSIAPCAPKREQPRADGQAEFTSIV
jgi:hypothetical protein